MSAWRPALDGDLAVEARTRVAALCDEIDRRGVPDGSLAIGHAGVALLHGYRARLGEADAAERAFGAVASALELVGERPVPWLFYGYAGIAYVLAQLGDVLGDVDEPLAQLHELIAQPLAADRWEYEWELVFGAIGLGVYGLERGDDAVVARVVDHLAACAERSDAGIAWTSRDEGQAHRYYNLGIAHGMAGAIAFLAAACARSNVPAAGVPAAAVPAAVPDLLRGAVAWLLARAQPDHTPIFPMTIDAGPSWHSETLDGWCYGDASTALVLAHAGAALHEPRWIHDARAIAHRVAARTPAQLARIAIDSSLCHGAISQAVILHRLACVLDDEKLLAAARGWYERALSEPVPAGMDAGLQTGLAGLAIGLVTSYADVPPSWTRAFLLG